MGLAHETISRLKYGMKAVASLYEIEAFVLF